MRVETLLIVVEDGLLLLRAGISHHDLHQEAVELRLRQGIRSFKFHRVLSGKHGEVRRERVAQAVNRHLAFFHGFQQRRLRPRRRAVHFVHQQQVGEHRPLVQRKRTAGHVEHAGPDNVRRHQVGGALHALEAEIEDARQRLHRQRLGQAGKALHQGVPSGQHHHQQLIERCLLSHNALGQFSPRPRRKPCHLFGHKLSVPQSSFISSAC